MKQADFYAQANIQPFKRDLSDKGKYFQQRDALLRQLGIVPRLLKGADIIEFGPGHGENSSFLLCNGPNRLVLVELSEECINAAKDLLTPQIPPQTNVEFHHLSIDQYKDDSLFDLVIFEGVIPFEPDPPALLRQTSAFVAPGGILSITCIDPVSLFSEILRRLIGDLAASREHSIEQRVEALLPIFSPHLNTVGGMTRKHEHWIIDQMIHPWSGAPLSIIDAANVIADNFDIYSSAPHFMADWRWFRDIYGDAEYLNNAQQQYNANLHNLMDYRFSRPPRDADSNAKIHVLCSQTLKAVKTFEENGDRSEIKSVYTWVEKIAEILNDDAPETSRSLQDYLCVLNGYLDGTPNNDFASFTDMFGRGQQYVSFIRKD